MTCKENFSYKDYIDYLSPMAAAAVNGVRANRPGTS